MRLSSLIDRANGRDTGFECHREAGAHRLTLWGRFPSNWATNLALQCCANAIDIRSGQVTEVSKGRWAASFLLQGGRAVPDYDFLAMARREPRVIEALLPSAPPTLRVRPSRTNPGSLFASARGKNEFGFLAGVLHHFHLSGLYARRMSIRTIGDETADWFWLAPRALDEAPFDGP